MTFFAGRILTAAELNALEASVTALSADSGWVNPAPLGSGWTEYVDPTYGATRYRKIGKLVQLRGLVVSSSIANPIFTLPAGFRPSLNLIFPLSAASWATGAASAGTAHVHAQAGAGLGELRVSSNGQVLVLSAAAVNAYVSLATAMFLVD